MKNTIKLTILVLVIFISSPLGAKEIKYKVSDIPKELRENARSVVRNEEIVFEVTSNKSATQKMTYAITILNKNGLDDAEFTEFYDKFIKISNIKGRVYDENGELVKRLFGDDIIDHSAISGFSIYEDNRMKYIDPKYRTVPFTVEYTYEVSFDGLFMNPPWSPYKAYNIAVEKSSYKLITPKNISIRYLEKNSIPKVKISSDNEKDTYSWEVINLKALIHEPYSLPFIEFTPIVFSTPVDFEYGGLKGSLSTWKDLGDWRYKLGENRNILPEQTKKHIQELVANATTDFEKISKIYEFMQNKTRYVSIQMGIGGLQPFEASTVDKLSYGDCKALTNYMKAMLEVVGIKSNVIWAYAGESHRNLIKELPGFYFNHDFLCIPLKSDTVWLECTSQRNPCGFIGDFTDDRDVFLIDKDNSKVVHTKAYTAQENKETRISHVTFESVSNGSAIINTNYHGLKYKDALRILLSDDADKKKMIAANISLPSFEIQNFTFNEHKQIIPSIEEKVSLSFHNYSKMMGQRIFLPLNFVNRLNDIPQRVRNRKTEVYIKRPSMEVDTVVYELPVNFKVESLPKPADITTQFGEYHARAEAKDRQVIYIRTFTINKGKYPATSYTDFIDFFEKVSTADGLQCSLVKNL